MPTTNLIVNGTFDSGAANWTGTDIEATNTESAYLGNGSSNRVAEMDGNSGQTTVMEQTFTVDGPITTDLTLDSVLRTAANTDEGSDGFTVEILDAGGGIVTTTTIFPGTGGYSSYTVPISFPAAGEYTLRFTEVGDDDSLGPIIDNISLLVCFAGGTRILTPRGDVAIEALRVGDLVETSDGPQVLQWIGTRQVSAAELAANDKLRPVRIGAGALGTGLPRRDLLVSRQHRMLTRARLAERMFDVPEALVAAIRLTELPGIALDSGSGPLSYYHLLFDTHRVVFAEGAPSESMLTGAEALAAVSPEARAELALMFPDMVWGAASVPRAFVPKRARAKSYVARLAKNGMAVLRD
jgi:hypothetical protein